MYLDCVSRNQVKVLRKLGFLKGQGFYLAGGTALALQIGHRRSTDLDFYIEEKFDFKELREELKKNFKKATFIQGREGTLIMKLEGVATSFFYYPYPLISPVVEFEDFPAIASIRDIGAMKMIAIGDRGIKRDFYDIYFLLEKFSLREIFNWVEKKYPEYNIYPAVRGLTYFKDAEEKSQRETYLTQHIPWSKVKETLIRKVNEYRKQYLK